MSYTRKNRLRMHSKSLCCFPYLQWIPLEFCLEDQKETDDEHDDESLDLTKTDPEMPTLEEDVLMVKPH